MEKTDKQSFMSLLVRDQESSSSYTKSPEDAQVTFNSMFSGAVNLQSILAATNPHPTQPLLPLSLFTDNYCNLTTTPNVPKSEQLYHQYGAVSAQSLNDYFSIFNHLPELLSLDHSHSSASYKRARLLESHPSYSHNHHPQTLASYQLYPTPPTSPAAPPHPVVPRGSSLARKRRQTLSDKMRYLQKLLPWDNKMDTATMLEAAHSYVRFLQAQLTALQDMPIVASDCGSLPVLTRGRGTGGGGDVDVLSRLSRTQLLQVLVNSPVAQMRMCSLGRCVFSVEQLALLNKRSVIRSAMVSGHYSPSFIDSSASASASASASTTN